MHDLVMQVIGAVVMAGVLLRVTWMSLSVRQQTRLRATVQQHVRPVRSHAPLATHET